MDYTSTRFAQTIRTQVPLELPARYDEDILATMVRDPFWAFAYWEVSDKTRRQTEEKFAPELAGSQIILRVHEKTGASGVLFDVPVGTLIGSWYYELQTEARRLYMELGYLTREGKFIVLAAGNLVNVPRRKPREEVCARAETERALFNPVNRLSEELQSSLARRFSQELASESFLKLP